ncbi:uncharacterized protein LOC143861488 [Tasmannia lanceolata]|uniref:uncharacterized protein LOC143861488 n=1 Tax=Tasmannia lanceolata TaxID=3420 RepID=UPI00406356E5
MPASPSWGTRSIFRVREEDGYHICYVLGDGKGIDFWKQPWHPAGLLTHLYPDSSLPNTVSPTATVDQLLNDGEWDPNIQFTLPNINTILNTALISPNPSNLAIWKPTPSGDFSLSSAWKCIRTHNPKPPWTPSIWFKGHVPRHSIVSWQALHSKLSTKARLLMLGSIRDISCPLCSTGREDKDHLFFNCSYSAWIWKTLLRHFSVRKTPARTLDKNDEWIRLNSKSCSRYGTALRMAFCATIYFIWKERNCRVFENKKRHKQVVLTDILYTIRTKILHLNLDGNSSSKEINLAETLNLPNFILKKDPKTCNWITPDPGWWKLNTDASLKEDKAAIGGLLRDAACNIIGSFSINKSPKTIQELEMEAIQKGICTALRHNISNLWLESDSLYSVSVINGKARCLWKLIPTLATISAKLSELPAWKITHSWREANGAADFLSKFECLIKGEDIPSDSLPLDLINIIRSDFSGTIYTRS